MANKISINDYYIEIIAQANDTDFLELLNAIPDLFKMRKRDCYRCSLKYLPEVLQVLRNITDVEQLQGKIKTLYQEEMRRRELTPVLKKQGTSLIHETFWDHQLLGIELAEINRRYGFFYDTRTGKTLMALQIMYDALKEGRAKRCIVVCPSAIIRAWLSDAEEHFPELKIGAYYGSVKQKAEAVSKPSHIIIWSLEQFAKNLDYIEKFKFDICFVDESSKIKSHRTQISKALRQFSLMVPSWYLLSATPAPNVESEYYTQMLTIDPYIFHPTRGHFVSKYFNDFSRSPNYEKLAIKPHMKDEFMAIVEERAIYVDQSVMPTAGKEWHRVYYDLPDKTRLVYEQMKKNMAAELHGEVFTVDMATMVRAKLNQITSGFIMDTEAIKENKIDKKLQIVGAPRRTIIPVLEGGDYSRIKQLDMLLKKLGNQKVVIWANYVEEFRMLEEYLGNRARYLRGGLSIGEKEQYIKEFKESELQYLVCHPLSVGMGINLTEAHSAIYYSLNDSWEAFKQSSERIAGHISVQPHKCNYYVILARNTIDELIYENSLLRKKDASYGLLEHLEAEALK